MRIESGLLALGAVLSLGGCTRTVYLESPTPVGNAPDPIRPAPVVVAPRAEESVRDHAPDVPPWRFVEAERWHLAVDTLRRAVGAGEPPRIAVIRAGALDDAGGTWTTAERHISIRLFESDPGSTDYEFVETSRGPANVKLAPPRPAIAIWTDLLAEAGFGVIDPAVVLRLYGADRDAWLHSRDLTIDALRSYADFVLLIGSDGDSRVGCDVHARAICLADGQIVASTDTARWSELLSWRTRKPVAQAGNGYVMEEQVETAPDEVVARLICADLAAGVAQFLSGR